MTDLRRLLVLLQTYVRPHWRAVARPYEGHTPAAALGARRPRGRCDVCQMEFFEYQRGMTRHKTCDDDVRHGQRQPRTGG